MQIERQEMRVFSAVVESGGFSRAAERLNISQSAVSQTIANLEHKLDTQLLLRKGKPVLTEAGKRLFNFTNLMLNEETNALADIAQIKTGALSTLNLAVNSMVNRFHAKTLLLDFCEKNPLTRLKLDVAPSKEIIYGVDADRWELGFGPFQNQMPGHFVCLPFFSERRMLVVHRNHPRLTELENHADRTLGELILLTSYLDEVADRPNSQRLRSQFAGVWEVGNLEMRLALAESGKGVMYLSDHLLAVLDGFVAIEGLEISSIPRTVGLYYKKHKALSEGAKRFVAICQAAFADRGAGEGC